MDQKTFESSMVVKYGAGKVAGVAIRGGFVYFRQPSQEEWDEFLALKEGEEADRMAYMRMLHICYLGAIVGGEQSKETLDDLAAKEGPAFIAGPCGKTLNKLAGMGDRTARFL